MPPNLSPKRNKIPHEVRECGEKSKSKYVNKKTKDYEKCHLISAF